MVTTDHEHILQRKVRTEIMLRTSSRFDFPKKKNPQKKWPQIDRLIYCGYQQKPGSIFQKGEKREAQKKSRSVRGRGTKHECSERASERELEGKGVEREGKGDRGKGRPGRTGGKGELQGVNNFSIIKIIVIIGRYVLKIEGGQNAAISWCSKISKKRTNNTR